MFIRHTYIVFINENFPYVLPGMCIGSSFFLHGAMDFAMICVIVMSMFDIYQCYTGI